MKNNNEDFALQNNNSKGSPNWKTLVENFADYLLLENGSSAKTIESYTSDITKFYKSNQSIQDCPLDLTGDNVKHFLEEETKKGVKASSTARFMCALRSFCKYLKKENLIVIDPCAKIDNPKLQRTLPTVLTEKNVEDLLQSPNLNESLGIRDRAMLETLYATGLRISELVTLEFTNLHIDDGYLVVRGKGDKERLVPLAQDAIYWINRYINEARVKLDPKRRCNSIFLSVRKVEPITRIAFWYRIKFYCEKLGLPSNISPHTFRHAFATHLLNHDADLRSVQLMLGHSSLLTTQIYTHVATKRMHDVFKKAHPRS